MLLAQSCPTSATPWTVALQTPLSLGFSRQESWSGSPCPSPGDLPDARIEPGSRALQTDPLPSEPQGSPLSRAIIHSNADKSSISVSSPSSSLRFEPHTGSPAAPPITWSKWFQVQHGQNCAHHLPRCQPAPAPAPTLVGSAESSVQLLELEDIWTHPFPSTPRLSSPTPGHKPASHRLCLTAWPGEQCPRLSWAALPLS